MLDLMCGTFIKRIIGKCRLWIGWFACERHTLRGLKVLEVLGFAVPRN